MNGWRDEYTNFEWLQMGLLLVGMPVAAVVGALLGMVGRWKQGRVLTAALVGMGGAAFVSIALFLLFLAVPMLAGDVRRPMLLELYDSTFSQWLVAKALIATGAVSLLAAVGLRLRERDKRSGVASLSMRQLMLLQLFSFIALGCWTGMRFIALDSVSGYELAVRKWSKHDWILSGNTEGEPSALSRKYWGPKAADYSVEGLLLKSASKEPWLRTLTLDAIAAPDKFDFGVLQDAKYLKFLSLSFPQMTVLEQKSVDQIGTIGSLEALSLYGGYYSADDLAPLANSSKLNELALNQTVVTPSAFNKLANNARLPILALSGVSFDGSESIQFPPSLVGLTISVNSRACFDADNLRSLKRLSYLQLSLPNVCESDLNAIAALPNLQYLSIQNVTSPKHLENLIADTELQQLTFGGSITVDQHYDYRQMLLLLAELPKLSRISCPSQFLFEGTGPTIASISAAKRPLSDAEMAESVAYQRQRHALIQITARNRMELFQARIDFRRDELKLGKLKIDFHEFRPSIDRDAKDPKNLDPEADLDSIGP